MQIYNRESATEKVQQRKCNRESATEKVLKTEIGLKISSAKFHVSKTT